MYGTSWFKVLFSLHSQYSHSLNSLSVVITNWMKRIFESIRWTSCVIGICIEPEVEPKTGKRLYVSREKGRRKQKKTDRHWWIRNKIVLIHFWSCYFIRWIVLGDFAINVNWNEWNCIHKCYQKLNLFSIIITVNGYRFCTYIVCTLYIIEKCGSYANDTMNDDHWTYQSNI